MIDYVYLLITARSPSPAIQFPAMRNTTILLALFLLTPCGCSRQRAEESVKPLPMQTESVEAPRDAAGRGPKGTTMASAGPCEGQALPLTIPSRGVSDCSFGDAETYSVLHFRVRMLTPDADAFFAEHLVSDGWTEDKSSYPPVWTRNGQKLHLVTNGTTLTDVRINIEK